jgi:uncharacterized protein (DUF433 family)
MAHDASFHWQSYIVRDPAICGGRQTMTGTRILLEQVLADIANGTSEAEIIAAYPSLTSNHVKAAIAVAALQQDRS